MPDVFSHSSIHSDFPLSRSPLSFTAVAVLGGSRCPRLQWPRPVPRQCRPRARTRQNSLRLGTQFRLTRSEAVRIDPFLIYRATNVSSY
jgi:hypothetical protein